MLFRSHAGVERNREGLSLLLDEIDELAARHGEGNAVTAARLVAASALARQESRGAHFRTDFPAPAEEARRTRIALSDVKAAPAPGERVCA